MMYQELEKRFKVIHPFNESATYSSLMNYSDDLKKPFQRWYRYKEGFSIELIKKLINEYNKNPKGIILDPFLGSGTTLMVSAMIGMKGIGFEVNPFSYFLSKCKLRNYCSKCIDEFNSVSNKISETALSDLFEYTLPKLSIANKVFEKDIEEYLLTVKVLIDNHQYNNKETKELLILGWLSCIEELSNYRKAGNGLKKRKYVKPRALGKKDAYKLLKQTYSYMIDDIAQCNIKFDVEIYNESSLNMSNIIPSNSISGIIFSPPYANCFDYTEIYKLELWFGEFVKDYSDLKKLRNQSLRSHLNGNLNCEGEALSTSTLNSLLNELAIKKLWDNKIPKMLKLYFNDMFNIINNSYNVLEKEGFCCIIVGNSAYGGVIFPTDLLLAEFAESIGFTVDKIEVDRYIITSSQQYETTKTNKRFLRESVVCLKKL